MDLKDKVAVITGASSGIGKACAQALAGRGAKVVLAARSPEKLQEVQKEINKDTLAIPADVSKEADCKMLIEETIQKYNSVDILINNAGISMRALFEDADLNVLKQLMDVNFWGAIYCTKYALPHILKSKGSIVGISSIAGFRGLPARTGYSASKFALQGFLEALRTELLKKNVHVMMVAPGFTASNIRNTALNEQGKAQGESPLNEGKIMSPEEVAEHIVKGIEKRKRDIILTRQGKLTVFLNKWLPGLMDKMVYKHFLREKDTPLK